MTVNDFIAAAEMLIGQPYTAVDCIGVIRKSLNIACQGTNWLWRSINNSSKYRYLTERYTDYNYYDGCVVFQIKWTSRPDGYTDYPDCHHIGVVCDGGKSVIHSSPSTGVRKDALDPEKWDAWGKLKQVEYASQPTEKTDLSVDDLALTDRQILVALYKKLVSD